jgi:hypothetical protein
VRQERIIGQQRVIGLLTFFAAPILLLGLLTYSLWSLPIVVALGLLLLFFEPSRSVGIGLLIGTTALIGALMVLAAMLSGVD